MKKSFLLAFLFFFMVTGVPVVHGATLQHAQGISEDEDFEDEDFGGGDSSSLDLIIEDLLFIESDLSDELEDSQSKPLKLVISKLDKIIEIMEDALEAVEDDDPDTCSEDLSDAIDSLEKAISLFERRQCKKAKASKKCISRDVVETYIEDLEDIFNTLDEEVSIDDDENDIPDICGFI